MNAIIIYIVASALLIPMNLLCSFWIFREVLNLSSMTFRELQNDLGSIAIPSGKFGSGLRRWRRVLLNHLAGKSADPLKTQSLFNSYLLSTAPCVLSILLTEYITLCSNPNKLTISFAAILILALINMLIWAAGKLYRRKYPIREEAKAIMEGKRKQHQSNRNTNIQRNLHVYILVAAVILVIYTGIHIGMVTD